MRGQQAADENRLQSLICSVHRLCPKGMTKKVAAFQISCSLEAVAFLYSDIILSIYLRPGVFRAIQCSYAQTVLMPLPSNCILLYVVIKTIRLYRDFSEFL